MAFNAAEGALDPVSFSDEAFPSYISLRTQAAEADAPRDAAPRKMRNAEVITEVLFYADAETNTRHKKADAEIQVERHINLATLGDNEEEGYYDEDERIARGLN